VLALLAAVAALVATPTCATKTIPYPPHALTVAAGSLWVACRDTGRIERRSADGRLLARVPTPTIRPWSIAAAGDAVWAIDRDSTSLLRIDPRRNRVVRTVRLTEPPIDVWGGAGSLWIAFDGSGSVARLDARTGRTIRRYAVGVGPAGFATDGTAVWVIAHRDGALVRIDASGLHRLGAHLAGPTAAPERLAWSDGSLWLTGRGLDLVRLDPQTGDELGTVEIGAAGIDLVPAGAGLAVVSATPDGARRGDPLVAAVQLLRGGAVAETLADPAFSLTGLAALGGRLYLLDGLRGRLVRVG
jgi:streptogramin lyase